MRLRAKALSIFVMLAILGSIVAACGGDDDDDDDDDDTQATATTSSPSGSTPAAGASPTAAGSEASPQGELTPVTVGMVPVLIYGPVLLAAEKGYFAEYGLDVTLEPLQGGGDMVVLTANGDFDVGIGGAGPAYFNALARGIDLKIVGPLHFEREPAATPLVVSKARFDSGELTGVADLEGKKVSVNAPGATEYWLDTALRTDGLTIEDVDLQYLGFSDVPAALESGALDGAMLGEPLVTGAEQAGLVVRLEADVPVEFQPTFVWFNSEFASENRDLAVGFMAGMLRGCRDLLVDDWANEENLAILNQYTGVDVELIREANRTFCEANGEIDVDDLATLQEFFDGRGLLEYDEPQDVETLIDRSFVEEALEIVGREE